MQPNTTVKFDARSFDRIKKTIGNMSHTSRQRKKNPGYAVDIPREVGIKLNNGCNLRCTHCYEWNEQGYHHNMDKKTQKNEIEISVIEKILTATSPTKAKVFLWGGEPLIYSKFDQLANLLEQDRRWTTCCTNGITIEKYLDSILKISENLALYISLDGLEKDNDAVRGKHTFKRVMKGVHLLLDLQKRGLYKGAITVSMVINDVTIGKMYEFVDYFENLGVDSVYLHFPWYIPPAVAHQMDNFVLQNFPWAPSPLDPHNTPSWHSFTYGISKENLEPLKADMKRINSKVWNVRVRFQPALEEHEVERFIAGTTDPGAGRTECLSISNRMEVLPDGTVTSCKFFPEFQMGNIESESISEVWHKNQFTQFRETLSCGLTPICSKCILLYLNGK